MATQSQSRGRHRDVSRETVLRDRWAGIRVWMTSGLAVAAITIAGCSGKESEPEVKASTKVAPPPTADSSGAMPPAPTNPAMEPVTFQIAINSDAGAQGDIRILDPKINHARLDTLKTTDAPPEAKVFDIQLHVPLGNISKGEKIGISFEAKADRERTADVAAILIATPTNLGLYQTLDLTEDWKSFEFKFDCAEEGSQPAISFNLGNDDAPVEIRKFAITRAAAK